MRTVLDGLLIATAVTWTALILTAVWVRHRLRRRLRIDPSVRSGAPTRFLISPRPAARLHRRLRRVGAEARLAVAFDAALAEVADDLVGATVALEPHVVAVFHAGRAAGPGRRELSARITELEAGAHQLMSAATRRTDPGGATAVRDRIDALESARQELTEIDVRSGVLRHA